jgi:hypothetical protein
MASDFFRNCSEEFFWIEILVGKQLALIIIYRTLLYETTCQSLVNFERLVSYRFAKKGKKMLTGHFLTNPSKIHSIFFVVAVKYLCITLFNEADIRAASLFNLVLFRAKVIKK